MSVPIDLSPYQACRYLEDRSFASSSRAFAAGSSGFGLGKHMLDERGQGLHRRGPTTSDAPLVHDVCTELVHGTTPKVAHLELAGLVVWWRAARKGWSTWRVRRGSAAAPCRPQGRMSS